MSQTEIEIPAGGAYFWANKCRYNIIEADGVLVVRCIEGPDGMSAGISLHMTSGNTVEIEAR